MPIAVQVVVATVAVVVVIVLMTRWRARRRHDALETIARESGWAFTPTIARTALLDPSAFPLFDKGHHHRVTNVVRGAASPITFATFDYRYDTSPTGAGDSSDVAEQTVVHMRSPQLSVPPFVLAPENVLHKIGNLLGYEDIDFDDTPEFSGRYFLRAKGSEVRVRETFTVPVRTFFEGRRPLNVEASDDQLLVYYDDRLRDPAELRSFIDEALEIARQFMR